MKARKYVVVVFILLLLNFSLCSVYALDGKNEGIILKYIAAEKCTTSLSIDADGKAKMTATLVPMSNTLIDEVDMKLELRRVSGNNVFNTTYNAAWDSIKGQYNVGATHVLVRNGIYEYKVTFKCFKKGVLIETIESDVITKTY